MTPSRFPSRPRSKRLDDLPPHLTAGAARVERLLSGNAPSSQSRPSAVADERRLSGASPGTLTLAAAWSWPPEGRHPYPKASDIPSPPCLLRLLPAGAFAGWGFHPLESAAFSRRTPKEDIPVAELDCHEAVALAESPASEGQLSFAVVAEHARVLPRAPRETPMKRLRGHRPNEASRCQSSSAGLTRCVVPSHRGALRWSTACQKAWLCTRSSARVRLVM
jgi:hypothetical protein